MFSDRKAHSLGKPRAKLAWPTGKLFKILSLDGGGIRGIYGSHLLAKCESQWGAAGNHFDLIAGTSTGGIIAIGLGLGLEASLIDDLYLTGGREIFPDDILRRGLLKKLRWLIRPVHNHSALERHLKNTFGERRFGDSRNRLVIPAFVGPKAQIAVFKTDHHPDYKNDWKAPAWQIARATSAAPTFFEGHKEEDSFFLDGGVWANNPIICAIAEALGTFEITPDQIRVLSIGTGSGAQVIQEKAVRAGAIGWRGIINTAMYLTSDSALSQARFIAGFDHVLRMDPALPNGQQIELDDWVSASRILPGLADADFQKEHVKLAEFFADRIVERERFHTTTAT